MYLKEKLKIGILANCQGETLASNLKKLPGVESVFHLPIHLVHLDSFSKLKKKFDELVKDETAIVLTQIINGTMFKEYITKNLLRNAKAKVLTISNLYFSGLHPDITYIGSIGRRLLSPLTHYHSKIILKCFFEGKSVKECFTSFNAKTYEKMDYFKEFELSMNEFKRKDKEVDIPIYNKFNDLVRTTPTMYTVNHHTPYIYQEYTALVAKKLGLEYFNIPIHYSENLFASNAWWPIYPEIAKYHNISYEMPLMFKPPNDFNGGKFLSLETFIEQSYIMYEKDIDALRKTFAVQNLVKLRKGYIKPISVIEKKLKALTEIYAEVEIHNESNFSWEGHPLQNVNLSYHWLDAKGNMIQYDGIRSKLENNSIPAKGSAFSSMIIMTPEKGGHINYR